MPQQEIPTIVICNQPASIQGNIWQVTRPFLFHNQAPPHNVLIMAQSLPVNWQNSNLLLNHAIFSWIWQPICSWKPEFLLEETPSFQHNECRRVIILSSWTWCSRWRLQSPHMCFMCWFQSIVHRKDCNLYSILSQITTQYNYSQLSFSRKIMSSDWRKYCLLK